MGIKNQPTKSTGEILYSADWNADHVIDSDVNFATHKATNVVDPTSNQDAATKKYVDDTTGDAVGRILAISPANFTPGHPDVDDVVYGIPYVQCQADGIVFYADVLLPHGAVVTGVIVYGNAGATAETWTLSRVAHTSGSSVMATANIGTEDTSITNATINNETYTYAISTTTLDNLDAIYGARITYTV